MYLASSDYGTVSCMAQHELISAAYLLVFLPFSTTPLFPSHRDSPLQYGTLGMIHSIPLTSELSGPAIASLQKAQVCLHLDL